VRHPQTNPAPLLVYCADYRMIFIGVALPVAAEIVHHRSRTTSRDLITAGWRANLLGLITLLLLRAAMRNVSAPPGCCLGWWTYAEPKMLKILVLLSATTLLLLSNCQGNRLNGSTSSTVVTTRTALT